ncbi:MAG: dihydrolipoamide acetyltransferase family protein [Pseudomonadales bacterium]|nr:2-oxo acid dehydrogenase subunit E2 [Pseudomonadales bacterium]
MSEYVFKLPDLGEGTVEAEIVAWHVKPGDRVSEGDTIADVMTDKANVEVPAPVTGTVLRTTGEPGDMVAVGDELIAFEVATDTAATPAASASKKPVPVEKPAPGPAPAVSRSGENADEKTHEQTEGASSVPAPSAPAPAPSAPAPSASAPAAPVIEPEAGQVSAQGEADARIRTSPAIRRHAKEAGISLAGITGTGPRGRILRRDLEAALEGHAPAAAVAVSGVGPIIERKVIGVRRLIATRLQASKREIPHFAYVEEVDVTALESLRRRLNTGADDGDSNAVRRTGAGESLTFLPFIAFALMRALKAHPNCNSHFDSERGVLLEYERVHLGIATQTDDGLKVPVVHNASSLGLRALAQEIARVAQAARDGSATRAELGGSTITLTSLGRLGGIVSTPVINAPEVAIIGINKAVKRPMVVDDAITVRLMMNLSSSFDHRFVDGYDAASLIQRMKSFLEEPATLFID